MLSVLESGAALLEDGQVISLEAVPGGDVVDGAVEACGVVMVDEGRHEAPGVVEGERCFRADALALERLVEVLQFAVALGGRRDRFAVLEHPFQVAQYRLRRV